MSNQAGIRLAVIDTDSAFLTVLGKRLDGAGWEYRVLGGSVPVEELVAMKLNALLVDLTVLGPHGWEFLEKVCGTHPRPRRRRLHRRSRRSPSASAACGSAPTTGSPSPPIPRR